MEDALKEKSPFALRVHPLSEGAALVLYMCLYVCGALVWANVSRSGSAVADKWPLALVFLLPFLLVLFRMLFLLFSAPWFAVAIIIAVTAISAVASVALPQEAALARVFRTFPFAALGATLAASILACVLSRPFSRRRIASIVMHAGLLVAIAGAFVSLATRTGGYVLLRRTETASSAVMRDYRLFLRDRDGRTASIAVPLEGADSDRSFVHRAHLGDVFLQLLYEPSASGSAALTVMAREGGDAGTARVIYGGAPAVLELGCAQYMASFGPSRLELPFEIALEDSSIEFYPGSLMPKRYQADIELISGGAARKVSLAVNHPVVEKGYQVLLAAVGPDGYTTLEVSRDPGAPILFVGGVTAIIGFTWGFARRLRRMGLAGGKDAS